MAAKVSAEVPSAEREKVVIGEQGYALGLAGFITSFFFGIVGIILSAIGRSQASKAGKRNPFATAGIIIGIAQTVITALFVAGVIALIFAVAHACEQNKDTCGSSQPNYSHGHTYDDEQTDPEQTY